MGKLKLLSSLKFFHSDVPNCLKKFKLEKAWQPQSTVPDITEHFPSFLVGEPTGGAGAASQPDRRAALRHGQALLGTRAGHGIYMSSTAPFRYSADIVCCDYWIEAKNRILYFCQRGACVWNYSSATATCQHIKNQLLWSPPVALRSLFASPQSISIRL